MLECVVNISEGRDPTVLGRLAAAAAAPGCALLDLHRDPDHNRSVFTLAGPAVLEGAQSLAREAVALLDLTRHQGAHPRLGVVDVVPFAAVDRPGDPRVPAEALAARLGFADWAGRELLLPCFLYGPERGLPQVRREAFRGLRPDRGPDHPHPTAGAAAVGARPVMVAYNLWLEDQDAATAARLARELRGGAVRALGFDLAGAAQLSFNLLDPLREGPAQVYDRAVAHGARVARAELVGLAPRAVLEAVPPGRRLLLDLSEDSTIEARLARLLGG